VLVILFNCPQLRAGKLDDTPLTATPAQVLIPPNANNWGKISESITNAIFMSLVPEGWDTFSQLSYLNKTHIMMFMLQVLAKTKLPRRVEPDTRTLEWLVEHASTLYASAGSQLGTGSTFTHYITENGIIDWTSKVGCYLLQLAPPGTTVMICTTKDKSMRKAPRQVTPANMHEWEIMQNWNESTAVLTNSVLTINLKLYASKTAVIPAQESWPTTPERTILASSPSSTDRQTRAVVAEAAAEAAAKRQRRR
jgi:hypothetical protein